MLESINTPFGPGYREIIREKTTNIKFINGTLHQEIFSHTWGYGGAKAALGFEWVEVE